MPKRGISHCPERLSYIHRLSAEPTENANKSKGKGLDSNEKEHADLEKAAHIALAASAKVRLNKVC